MLYLYIVLTLGVSFLCSILEAMLLSISPSYVAALQEQRPKLGRRLAQLKGQIDRPLGAILTLNTVANTIGASGVGAQVYILWGSAYVTGASFLLTLAILYLAEIIPKTLGAKYWRQLAPLAARILPVMIWVTLPIVGPTKPLMRLFGRSREPLMSREEFSALATLAAKEGMLHEKESLVLRNLGKFSSLVAKDIMTPRTVIAGLEQSLRVGDVVDQDNLDLRFSRIPVFAGDIDEINGFVHKHDILLRYARGEVDVPLETFMRPLVVIPELAKISDLFDQLLKRKEHMALLVDEYGGTAGIVTMEDVVETLLGMEIVDEFDDVVDMQSLARQQWQRRAQVMGILEDPLAGDDAAAPAAEAEAPEA